MASVAVHLKSKHKSPYAILRSPAFTSRRLLSSKSNNDENNENPRNSSSFSFSDLKASLKQPQEQQRQPQSIPRKPFSFSQDPKPEKISSLEEIKKNLSNFRARYTAPEPLPPSADSRSNSDKFSFQKLYPRNAANKSDEAKITIDAIRENLRTIKIAQNEKSRNVSNAFSLSKYRESLKLSPKGDNDSVQGGNVLIGGTSENLPWPVFGKEMSEKEKEEEDKLGGDMRKAQLVKAYTESELGAKLRTLRPEGVEKKKDGFSLKELNERLIKLRELEEKESESRGSGASSIEGLRDHLSKIKFSEDEKTRRSSFQRFDILSPLGGTPSFMQAPPKENLVEKYFHPDNMSSAEKLKLELKRMREEFKKHETDCGSEPVQIAQLTTEINHLASVLHKKDKHSRKGLLAKVQKRKSLLKYLRRTDWESYCFVLSRLGLRDNPDYKN